MKDLKQTLQNECYGRDLEQRKHWYSPAAEAYQQVRPRYPQALIDRVVDIAQLSANSSLLEIGCGPAIATPAFAALGCYMVCVEPNSDFYHLAQQTCTAYPQVELQNYSFEEWELAPQSFDAVLAASSFHWIPPEIGYPKAAAALRPEGQLILLWNKELQPQYEVYQQLSEIYQTHEPTLNRSYEDSATQMAILNEMGQMAIASGYFQDLVAGHIEVEVTYTVDQYLLLLNTYSPYLKLEAQQKQSLFAELRQVLEQNGDTVQLAYVSAFHIFRPA
ncbi:class I SAM-dependent methyltransferase [Leptolyngbya sp. FACHB-671]|uniref:class I SAM-dependent methyltransferase n=1 Tax=Leptolyngbya sp. FACHB-671 TaxID=2692812 RepID=UPI0016876157|nr:class I SAM-dependent methyltransferase [Leptolyngbya sp. FACHB-671]MBD2067473.1 class I SAM-dependent methyltransferase [Leptolyngbya sp. FACHB-671]